MPLTGAEINRQYRDKIQANAEKYAAYKEKDKVRKRETRKKVISRKKAERERMKCRERVRLHRLKKKMATLQAADNNDVEFTYKSPQALGKTVHKVSPLFPRAQGKGKQPSKRLQNQVALPCQVNLSSQMAIHPLPNPL